MYVKLTEQEIQLVKDFAAKKGWTVHPDSLSCDLEQDKIAFAGVDALIESEMIINTDGYSDEGIYGVWIYNPKGNIFISHDVDAEDEVDYWNIEEYLNDGDCGTNADSLQECLSYFV